MDLCGYQIYLNNGRSLIEVLLYKQITKYYDLINSDSDSLPVIFCKVHKMMSAELVTLYLRHEIKFLEDWY